MKKQLFSFLFASLLSFLGYGQITIDESLTTQELVEDVLINSSCAEVSNFVSSTGTNFGDVNGIAAFSANGSDFPFEEGILLMSGDVQAAPGPNTTTQSNGGWPGDADLEANTSAINTNNASFIEFDFTPFIEQISFNFIMASEEYDQNFECTFSDAFAFILTDITTGDVQNLAVLPGTTIPIEVTNIRPEVPGQCAAVNEEFFDRYNFQPFNDENASATNFNGQTVQLTAMADVISGNPYRIKLVVADQSDSAFDIGVFLEAGSFNIGTTDLGDDILLSNGNAACEGDTITLNADDPDAVSYTWFMDGTELVGETNPTLDVTMPGTYAVSVSLNNTDCTIEDEIVVEFITASAVNLGDDIDACETDMVVLDVDILDSSASFSWFFNSTILIDETSSTLNVTEAGEYAVVVTFNSGCTFSDVIMVDFTTAPIIELGETINSCLVDPVILDATPSNLDPSTVTYAWFLDDVVLIGETSPTLSVTQEGVYTVVVSVGPCDITDSVTVAPLAILFELGDDFNTCFESTVTLDATPTNVDPDGATYEWSLDGNIIAGQEDATLDITEEGTYEVTVSFGICSNTDSITVTLANADGSFCVEPEECETIEVDAGLDQMVDCENPCVDLVATVVAPFTTTASYRIDQTECIIPISGGTPTNITVDDTWSNVINLPFTFTFYQNDYTSLVVGANGQISFDTSLANGFNDWNIDPDQTIPNDDQATFPFNTIYGAFHDINPGVNGDPDAINFFISGEAPFRAFVLNFDMVPQFSCTDLITSQQIILYETVNIVDVNITNKPVCDTWNDGLATLGILGNDNTEFAVPPGRNTGAWEATDENWRFVPDGESDEDVVFTWTDEDGNVLSNDLIFNVCPTETTTYTASITFTNSSDGSTVTISDDVTVTSTVIDFMVDLGNDEVFCDVTSFEIVPTITGDTLDNPSFLWSTGETTETITVSTSGTYSVEIDAGGGCIMSDEIMVTFSTAPTLDLGMDAIICDDEAFTISPVITGDNINDITYSWSTGETTETITVNSTETISLTITNAEGCTTTDSIVITIADPVNVSLGDDFTTCREFPNTLTSVSDNADVTYQWLLNGDIITGETASTLDFSIPESAVGTQIYTVIVTTAAGCTSEDSVDVSLFDVGNCVISQGISPDDTPGFNDTLDLEFLAARTGIDVLQIYNRLGALVYEQNNYVNQWRGQTDDGNDLPTGTYFYVINLEGDDPVYGTQATGWVYINRGN
ncbi:choice-of-anchor L domain-containing protein [Dokdonia ponticola]|uniref:Choice-of-anchor L domain-containing protein n=1 Tax=Dokdonia ponticola TaxID=2041041 RepID=A0ABV9I0Q3_9FLAO